MSKKDQNAGKLEQNEQPEPTKSLGFSDNNPEKEPAKTASKRSRKQPQRPATKSGQSLSFLALLLALIALVLSGYIGWRAMPVEQAQPDLIEGQKQQQTQIARLQARLTEINRELTPIKTDLSQQEDRSERLLNRTDTLTRSLQEVAGTSQEGWKLAEVEYLLRLANQRLLMSSDTKAAKALLNSADQILLQLDNYNLYPVREALAEDIASLNSLPDFDQEGLYLKLEALTHQIYQLPLMEKEALTESSTTVSEVSETASKSSSNWQTVALSMLGNTWESFVSLFRFTPDREQKITSLLSPEENILIRQNLQLMLEQAKLSVLSRDQAIYNSSLKQASHWIEKYFSLSGSQATAMLDELKALGKVTVKPATTNISRALDLLKSRQITDALESGKNAQENTKPEESIPAVQKNPITETPEATEPPVTENQTESSQPQGESPQPSNNSLQPSNNSLQPQNNAQPLDNSSQPSEAPAGSAEEPQT
ncbi:MAG: uroporphyrinogen-III C-methyltransferase [Endozoicomonas sp.]|uniref:uroporphyrinogen-III C-methyltransferase n=1 Tax=Endozoicomonas sp. TaxID=1892382 RepID=UPI003D9BBCAA